MQPTFNQKQLMQEEGYSIPYHYVLNERSLPGILYMSYLQRAAELTEELRPSALLDGGCGDGRYISFLHERANLPQTDIQGTDYSERAIAFAKIYNPETKFTFASLASLPYAEGVFDGIALIETVEHIPFETLPGILRECRRVLRPKGFMIITTPSVRERPVGKDHYQHFTLKSLRQYLTDSGWEIRHSEGNFKDSILQRFLQKLLRNSLYEIRYVRAIALYRWLFRRFWAQCSVESGRRIILIAEPC